jgi:hypothetical protein
LILSGVSLRPDGQASVEALLNSAKRSSAACTDGAVSTGLRPQPMAAQARAEA